MHVRLRARCLTLCYPMDCSPPGSSVYGIFQARMLDRVANSLSVESFPPRERIRISCISWLVGGVSLRQASNSTLSLRKGESEITSRKIIFHHETTTIKYSRKNVNPFGRMGVIIIAFYYKNLLTHFLTLIFPNSVYPLPNSRRPISLL